MSLLFKDKQKYRIIYFYCLKKVSLYPQLFSVDRAGRRGLTGTIVLSRERTERNKRFHNSRNTIVPLKHLFSHLDFPLPISTSPFPLVHLLTDLYFSFPICTSPLYLDLSFLALIHLLSLMDFPFYISISPFPLGFSLFHLYFFFLLVLLLTYLFFSTCISPFSLIHLLYHL